MAQTTSQDSRAVYGKCSVAVERPNQSGNFAFCVLSGGIGETVPAGYELVIENVSAACTVDESRGLFWFDMGTQLAPSDDEWNSTVLPLQKMGSRGNIVSLAATMVTRLYAGPGTRVSIYMNLASPDGPPGACQVLFQGRLIRVAQSS